MHSDDFPLKWWALIGLSLLSFTAFLDFTIVSTALPFIQKELHASVLQLQWVTNIFGMVLCMFMIAVGQAGDFLGHKRIFIFGFILFLIAALGAGFSPSIQWLIFFRAVQGFAGAIIFTIGVALLPQAFPLNEQQRAIGIYSAFNGAGLAIGPFLGGLLISYLSWRWVFWINIPIIIVGLASCVFALKPSPTVITKIKMDWLGLLFLVSGLGFLIYGLIYGEEYGWNYLAWIFIVVGIVCLKALYFVELKIEYPLLNFSIFKNNLIFLSLLVSITTGFITFVFLFFDPLYLENIKQFNALSLGLILLTIPVVQVIVSLVFEKWVVRYPLKYLLYVAFVTAILAGILHFFFSLHTNLFFIILAFILMGYTWGIANVGSITAVMENVPSSQSGNAIGTIFTFWNISGSIFLALASVIFHSSADFLIGLHRVAGFSVIIFIIIFIIGLSSSRALCAGSRKHY